MTFPQEEDLTAEVGNAFFKEQTYTGIAENTEIGEVVGLYILHPNNVGRCGHISNASYAVRRDIRGEHIGEKLVLDCLRMAKEKGFRVMQFNAVVASNTHVLHLYERIGFTKLGVIPGGFRLPDTATDETSLPTGIENVYYVDPENIKEAFARWDYQDEPDKVQQKDFWHCLGQIQVWLHWEKPICALFSWHHRFLCQIIQLRHLQETIMRHPLQWQAPLQEVCLILCSTIFLFFQSDSDSPVRHLQRQMPVLLSLARCCEV